VLTSLCAALDPTHVALECTLRALAAQPDLALEHAASQNKPAAPLDAQQAAVRLLVGPEGARLEQQPHQLSLLTRLLASSLTRPVGSADREPWVVLLHVISSDATDSEVTDC
jgi:hypothetical protein